ncbi:eae-like domain protein [Citrobacter sedlakii]|uniref:eae-like domain protein n=1 Tax=Citrobacter sedlakii TaxID=67826 RepID=UPI00387E1B28
MTANKPMTGEQLDELMTIAVNMQRDSEKVSDRPAAMFAYAVQVAVLELRKVRTEAAALAAENAGLKAICEDRRMFIMNGVQLGYIQVPTVETDPALETIRVAVSPQEPTPATDAFLAEVRAHGVEGFLKFCGEENSVFVEAKAYYRSLSDAVDDFAAQVRKGVQS